MLRKESWSGCWDGVPRISSAGKPKTAWTSDSKIRVRSEFYLQETQRFSDTIVLQARADEGHDDLHCRMYKQSKPQSQPKLRSVLDIVALVM
jgi:hypothetical protein